LSKDLREEFPDMRGFSKRNLELMRQWYLFWITDNAIGQQAAAPIEKSRQPVDQCIIAKQLATQIPWWHNVVIISKIKNQEEALFYVQKTIENNWSRAVLTHHDYVQKKEKYFLKNIDTCPNSLRILHKYQEWTPEVLQENHTQVLNEIIRQYGIAN
jgi:hypothetical protein